MLQFHFFEKSLTFTDSLGPGSKLKFQYFAKIWQVTSHRHALSATHQFNYLWQWLLCQQRRSVVSSKQERNPARRRWKVGKARTTLIHAGSQFANWCAICFFMTLLCENNSMCLGYIGCIFLKGQGCSKVSQCAANFPFDGFWFRNGSSSSVSITFDICRAIL